MIEIKELLSQINENPRLLAQMDIIEETDVFDKDRMREIVAGLNNEKLIDAFIRLAVNKWNSLEARHDRRLYINGPYDERLKFTGEGFYDQQGNYIEDSIDYFMDSLKTDELRARELEAKEIKEQEEILSELGFLDEDVYTVDTNDGVSVTKNSHPLEIVGKKLNKISNLISVAHESENEILKNYKESNALLDNLKQLVLDECQNLVKENEELRNEVEELSTDLKAAKAELNDLLNPEPIELTEEEIAEYQRREVEFREYEKLQFDKALQEATEELERKSVKITALTNRVLDIPDYSEQLVHFRVLSFLLAGNKAWQQVEGTLVDQINKNANERKQQKPFKFADQINVMTGKDAQANYTSSIE